MVSLAQVPSDSSKTRDLEEAVIGRAIRGDERALSHLYQRHATHIATAVRRCLGHDAEVDDIVQETFVQGLGQLASLREPSKLRSFLMTIAVRRSYARLSLRYKLSALMSQLFQVAPAASVPETADRAHALFDALNAVNPRHRMAWVLHRVEGYTLPEVANLTDSSLTTVKRWIAKVDDCVEAIDES